MTLIWPNEDPRAVRWGYDVVCNADETSFKNIKIKEASLTLFYLYSTNYVDYSGFNTGYLVLFPFS
jgi:hypothetical protein